MSTLTTNYSLVKAEGTDLVNEVTQLDDNWDSIDTIIKDRTDRLIVLETDSDTGWRPNPGPGGIFIDWGIYDNGTKYRLNHHMVTLKVEITWAVGGDALVSDADGVVTLDGTPNNQFLIDTIFDATNPLDQIAKMVPDVGDTFYIGGKMGKTPAVFKVLQEIVNPGPGAETHLRVYCHCISRLNFTIPNGSNGQCTFTYPVDADR